MKRIRRAYSKTVSLIDETAVQIYQSFVGKRKGFLLESYDKNNGRYVFMGKNPEEVIKSKENGLVIEKEDGTTKELSGNPVDLLKGYYSDFEIRKDDEQLAFTGGLVGGLGYDFVRYKEELPDNNPDEIGISTISLMLVTEFLSIDHFAETMTAVVVEDDTEAGRKKATGYNYDRLAEKMNWLGIDLHSIRHILITHQDTDHVGAVEADSPGLFRDAALYIGEIENRYLTGEVRRRVIYHLYKLPQVTINNEKVLLHDDEVIDIDGIRIECFLVPGHTWGHMVYLVDGKYLFTGDTIWFGAAAWMIENFFVIIFKIL